ncbi:hypothetical protein Tco_0947976 [Tanacetum coccineum]
MILRDGDERLILNMRHDTSSYLTQPHQESINMMDVYNVSHEEILKDLFATNYQSGNPTFSSHTDLTLPEAINPSSGIPTLISEPVTKSSSSSSTLTAIEESDLIWEEFEAYLARIDYLPFDAEPDLREIEYLLNNDLIKEMDSILEDSVDKNSPDDNLVNTLSEMITHRHHYGMIMMMNFLILRPFKWFPSFPECGSVFYVDFSEVDALSSTNNEYKVFNSGILIHENHFEVTNCATMEKNVKKITYASLILEDFNPPLYELPFHKEVPGISWIFEASRARSFILRSLELQILSFILGIRYPNLID